MAAAVCGLTAGGLGTAALGAELEPRREGEFVCFYAPGAAKPNHCVPFRGGVAPPQRPIAAQPPPSYERPSGSVCVEQQDGQCREQAPGFERARPRRPILDDDFYLGDIKIEID